MVFGILAAIIVLVYYEELLCLVFALIGLAIGLVISVGMWWVVYVLLRSLWEMIT